MSDEIKIDLSKVLVADYLELLEDMQTDSAFAAMLKFSDKAVVGGAMERSMLDIPAIFGKLVKALQEEADSISIAVSSMHKYLTGGEQ
jgi:hypothetical protein